MIGSGIDKITFLWNILMNNGDVFMIKTRAISGHIKTPAPLKTGSFAGLFHRVLRILPLAFCGALLFLSVLTLTMPAASLGLSYWVSAVGFLVVFLALWLRADD
jgi:hypothetical protein